MSAIQPPDLDDALPGEVFVLDVRSEQRYRADHIERSYNAPVYGALRRGDTGALDDHLDAVPADAQVVTVCRAGVVARRATSHLRDRGYDATTLAGGMRRWRGYRENTPGYRLSAAVRGLLG